MLEYTNQVTAVATVEEYIISLILLCREVGSIVAWIKDKVSPLSLNMDFSKNKWYISWTAVKKMCSFSMHATFKFYPCILISWLTDLVGKWIALFRQKRADRNEKKMVKGICKMNSHFTNSLYNLAKVVVDEEKLVKYFSLFYSMFCFLSFRSVTQCIGPTQLTTLLTIYLMEMQSA